MTPFRIDFDDVAAPANLEEVVNFEVFAKAVVTSHNLSRDLASWTTVKENKLELRAVNIGTNEATIPHAILSLYDDQGLAWVAQQYGMEAIPPREARTFDIPIALPKNYQINAYYKPSFDEGTVFDSLNQQARRTY